MGWWSPAYCSTPLPTPPPTPPPTQSPGGSSSGAPPPQSATPTYPTDCVLWGVSVQMLVLALFVLALSILARFVMLLVFFVVEWVLRRRKLDMWGTELRRQTFFWSTWLFRTGMFWLGVFLLTLPPNWTNVLQYIVPIPFILCLFAWFNCFVDAVATIRTKQLSTYSYAGGGGRSG